MISRTFMALLIVAMLSTASAAVSWQRYHRVSAARDAAIQRAQQVSGDVEELLSLRSNARDDLDQESATSMLGPLNRALGIAGVTLDSLTSAVPEATTVETRSGTVSLHATRISLERLTLSQLGQFLATWRTQQPASIPASIEITPLNDPTRPDHIRVRILLVSTGFGAPR